MMFKISHKFRYILLVISFSYLLNQACKAQNDRETWQPPGQIMDSVGIIPGMRIGEIGAGRGHFTFHLAQRVGDDGKVYANDISQSALDILSARSEEQHLDNISPVLGDDDDPLFPEKDLDIIIMVYVLHHVEHPVELLNNLKKYMKPETRLIIIEKNIQKDRDAYPHFMSKDQVIETLQLANYKQERIETFLPKDIIYIYSLVDRI